MIIYKPNSCNINGKVLYPLREMPGIRIAKKNLGEVCIETFKDMSKLNELMILLKDNSNKILGSERLVMGNNNPNAAGLYIETSPEFRRKGYGIGEILRLSSIILILKNKIKEFEIFSKAEAVYFHSKYKFEPAIRQFSERDIALSNIIYNCQNEFKDFAIRAKQILEKCQTFKSPESQRGFCVETNALLKEYIQEVLKTKDKYKSHSFKSGFRMILDTNEILNNKEYFNSLYKKQGIDYKI